MPSQGPGRRHNATATKAVIHGDPCIEDNLPGVAFKSAGLTAFIDPTTAAATTIAVAEPFVIMLGGMQDIRAAKCPGAALPAVGAQLWILSTDNTMQAAAGTNRVKFGVVDSVDTVRQIAHVNTNARDTF